MSVTILVGDVREKLRTLPADSFDCVVTSPPYWGLRDYGVAGQIGLEPTLGEHIAVMVEVFREVRRVLKPSGTLWLNYGDCYATTPNGRSAADTKLAGNDDRTFRDKPFSTIGPIYAPDHEAGDRRGGDCKQRTHDTGPEPHRGRIVAGGQLKPKDLCMVPNRLAIALQEDGWWVRSEIIWGKSNPMPDSAGRYRPGTAHEKIFMLVKAPKHFYNSDAVRMATAETAGPRLAQNIAGQQGSHRANGGAKTNGTMKAVGDSDDRLLRNYEPAPLATWVMGTAPFSEAHFATFPPELVERCLKAGCPKGGTVLDPFGGAGTTALVADQMQLDATIIELNPDYVHIAVRRIEADRGDIQNALDPLHIDLLAGAA